MRPKLIPNPNQKYLQRIIQAKDFGNKLRLLQAVSDEVAERVLKVKGKPWGFLLRAKWAKKITVRWCSEVKRRHLPKYISWLLQAVPDEAFQLNWRSGHHMLLFLTLHRNRRNWNNLWHLVQTYEDIFAWRLPMMLSLKIWLILGFVDTWQSKLPASDALVNFSFSVFCPRLGVEEGQYELFPIPQLIQSRQSTTTCTFFSHDRLQGTQ